MKPVSPCLEASRDSVWSSPSGLQPPADPQRAADAPRQFLARLAGTNPRHMSPRTMSNLSLDLYLEGMLRFDEYELLAVQPELHPDFNRTIGALTGRPAEPDRPRDFVRTWTERLLFERRHGNGNTSALRRIETVLGVLRRLESRSLNHRL